MCLGTNQRVIIWIAVVIGLLLGVLCCAYGADGDPEVQIIAPADLMPLLNNNLTIAKSRAGNKTAPGFFRSLYRSAPAEITALLATEGYFAPQIAPSIQAQGSKLIARFDIKPGLRTKVGSLRFVGEVVGQAPSIQPSPDLLRKQWGLPVDADFVQAGWESAKAKLLRAFLTERYPTASFVSTIARIDRARSLAALTVVIDSGPAVTLGELEISGLQRYDEALIRNLNPLKIGETYSQSRLLQFQERLQNTLYFSAVAVTANATRIRPNAVPVHIAVTETLSRRLGLGGGVNTDTGLRGQIEYSDYNVGNKGWRFTTNIRTETSRQVVNGSFDFPTTPEGYRYGINAIMLRTTVQNLDTTTVSIGGRRSILADGWEKSIGLEYLWEHEDEGGLQEHQNGVVYPSIAWTLRHFDNVLDPNNGYGLNLQIGAAAKALLSDQNFLRAYGKWIGYIAPFPNGQLILRAEAGAVLAPSQQGIPTVLLFRTGGDQSVRGYAFQSLGLRRGNSTVGARYLTVGSAEYVHWITSHWGAAAFCDVGDAFDEFSNYTPNLGFGMGARWRSPVGSVALDIAYGEASEQVRLHFALGIRF
jgi:translocation and assembly module TamA